MTKLYLLSLTLLVVRVITYLYSLPLLSAGTTWKGTADLGSEPTSESGRQVIKVDSFTLYAQLFPEFHFGDRINFAGLISCPGKATTCDRPIIYKPQITLIGQGSRNFWRVMANRVRAFFETAFDRNLTSVQANLLKGIVLGSQGLDRQFKEKLANAGLTHVVAASGMNISLFSGLVAWLVSFLKVRKIYKAILVILFIGFYSTITGFEPPIVRAGLMAILTILAIIFGRQGAGWMALLVTAYLMLWVSPTLISSASFLLSFSAMAGQVFLSSFASRLTRMGKLFLEYFLQSLVAIIFTFPIVVVFFSRFSLISVFTNALVLWTVEPLMLLGGLAGILAALSVRLASAVLLPSSILLDFFLWVVEAFGRHQEFLLRLPKLDGTFVLGYYLILGGILLRWRGGMQKLPSLRSVRPKAG